MGGKGLYMLHVSHVHAVIFSAIIHASVLLVNNCVPTMQEYHASKINVMLIAGHIPYIGKFSLLKFFCGWH